MIRAIVKIEEVLNKRGVLIEIIYHYEDGTRLKRKIGIQK